MACIRGVIFDFGGVLTEECWDSRVIAKLTKKGLEKEGVKLNEDFIDKFTIKLYEKFKEVLQTGVEERMENIIREFLEENGIEYNEKAIERALNEINKAPFCKFRGNIEQVLKELREMGLKLGVISNTPSDFPRRLLEERKLIEYFDAIVLSCEVGYRKPLKEIYKIALNKLNLAPEEVIFIGDTLQIDIKGAKEVGMISVLISEGDPVMRENGELLEKILGDPPEPDFVIDSLEDVVKLVKRLNESCS